MFRMQLERRSYLSSAEVNFLLFKRWLLRFANSFGYYWQSYFKFFSRLQSQPVTLVSTAMGILFAIKLVTTNPQHSPSFVATTAIIRGTFRTWSNMGFLGK